MPNKSGPYRVWVKFSNLNTINEWHGTEVLNSKSAITAYINKTLSVVDSDKVSVTIKIIPL